MVPALSGVPGIEPAVVVELLRGGNKAEVARTLDVRSRRGSLASLSLATARLALQERRLAAAHLEFERDADQHRRWLAEMDLAILPDDSLVTTLRETQGFLESTGRLLLSCSVVALASHLALQAALSRVLPDASSKLAYALTSGATDLESAHPAVALAHVTELFRADAEGARALASAVTLGELPDGAGKRALGSWLEAFGDRGLAEVEAMRPRFSEEPSPVFRMVRAGLGAEARDPETALSRVRAAADSELAVVEAHAGQLEMALVRALVGRARSLSRLRERMRVWMARTVAMTRRVALDVDRRLGRLDPLLPAGSAFFLRHQELVSATARTRADLGPLVRMRAAAHARCVALPDPPDTFIGVPPRIAPLPFDARVSHGTGASGGVVTGRVRRVGADARGAQDLSPGDVIVARTPDVAISPLFFWAAGMVADAGSALSHAAVVAREAGMPAVFGVVGASTTLRDGEHVRIDGDRGVVERLDP
jgi:pyruvate,water dikinase